MSITEKDYYKRQMVLPEVQSRGQNLLKEASVFVVGAGGLGTPLLSYIARAGVGRIGVADHDKVSETNLHRQLLFHTADIGYYKADLVKRELSRANPFIKVESIKEAINSENIEKILSSYQIIVDCSDNFKTKFLLHDYAQITRKCYLSGSIYRMEGEFKLFDFKHEGQGCLRCLTPQVPKIDCTKSCEEAGVLGTTAGTIGTLMGSELLKLILNKRTDKGLATTYFDLSALDLHRVGFQKSAICPLCTKKISLSEWFTHEFVTEISAKNITGDDWVIYVIDCDKRRVKLPITEFKNIDALDKNKKSLLVCSLGTRSFNLAREARSKGNFEVYSLFGGEGSLKYL